jgi:growth arrest-specific protein 8
MPPKPAAKGGKDAAAAAAAAPPPLDPEAETERRFLVEQCKAMKSQRIFEEAQLAQFHQEKERLNELWISAKKDLEEVKASLRAKEREKDDLADAQNVEIKVYKQRIKHLLFEHQSEATDARTDAQTALKLQQEKERDSEKELKVDRRDLKAVLREIEVAHEDYLKALKLEHDRNITDLRLEFERDTREMQSLYEDRMTRTREELNRAREEEIKAIERRKSKHIAGENLKEGSGRGNVPIAFYSNFHVFLLLFSCYFLCSARLDAREGFRRYQGLLQRDYPLESRSD